MKIKKKAEYTVKLQDTIHISGSKDVPLNWKLLVCSSVSVSPGLAISAGCCPTFSQIPALCASVSHGHEWEQTSIETGWLGGTLLLVFFSLHLSI